MAEEDFDEFEEPKVGSLLNTYVRKRRVLKDLAFSNVYVYRYAGTRWQDTMLKKKSRQPFYLVASSWSATKRGERE